MATGKKVLISRLSAHGDVIQTLPLLSRIKSYFPDAEVGWVVEESAAPFLTNHPQLSHLHVFKKSWVKAIREGDGRWDSKIEALKAFSQFVNELRTVNYDISLDVQGLFKSGLMPVLAGVPKRFGFKGTREYADIFYTDTLPYHDLKNPNIPTVTLFTEFIRALGIEVPARDDAAAQHHELFEFVLPPALPESKARAEQWINTLPGDRPVIALAPETIWRSKHWTDMGWATVCKSLAEQEVSVILLGTKNDIIHRIAQAANVTQLPKNWLNLVGKTSFQDMRALFESVDVLIGLDSAPLHLANAVGHPLILGIYGPTSPKRTGPIGSHHLTATTNLDCQPCFQRHCPLKTRDCMKQLLPEQVLEGLQVLLKRHRTRQILAMPEHTS